ncbi:DUF4235 domain-containing protein [Paenarthrobacter sp. Z7-10]|uniref:DUF4235 domain-containing protein n=1 Tax=Paenarthrobacter sp. Z7-10 TaxID=2787635 RepID=UPI0022A8D466|nr:DUF4235 domain-containing protein [Paenarthrobacter sp. Z7-10]MCZ2401869.1 DUF4235 domain-containing protein [Paenarthrobacter sp. Z7-10]
MNLLLKLVTTGVSVGAVFVANKIVEKTWEKCTGKKPPKDGTDPTHSLRSALIFALVSAAVAAMIQVIAGRGTQRAILRLKGKPEEI